MLLDIGAPAPDFTAVASDGTTHALSDYRGRRVWLAFYRYASCPLCNLRVRQAATRAPAWQAQGLALLAVFQSPPERVRAWVGRERPPFPLLCDPEERIYADYEVGASLAGFVSPASLPRFWEATRAGIFPGPMDGTKTRMPADFLIDEAGVVRDVFGAGNIGEHIPFERVDRFLEA